MVFKVGCIRPRERKGKFKHFFHFYHVKIRGDYQALIRIFENTTRLLPFFIKKSSKNDYAKLDDAKLHILNILRFSFTWDVPCSDGNKLFFLF